MITNYIGKVEANEGAPDFQREGMEGYAKEHGNMTYGSVFDELLAQFVEAGQSGILEIRSANGHLHIDAVTDDSHMWLEISAGGTIEFGEPGV